MMTMIDILLCSQMTPRDMHYSVTTFEQFSSSSVLVTLGMKGSRPAIRWRCWMIYNVMICQFKVIERRCRTWCLGNRYATYGLYSQQTDSCQAISCEVVIVPDSCWFETERVVVNCSCLVVLWREDTEVGMGTEDRLFRPARPRI
ncbi:hypothetical protein P691DRAFT_31687 [Macrolepiota fuliginosa MF-IS2]|uniref:Uncharacterized protein n=1 Tax=Macrolepiota fuliginosa MF-IS2 TaxID=1400762 RepID=A0A9P5WYY1_9AGAR|nr:hypothetical protein P691DRAFT_31687 [Macrolepiota fuliginosa MF-IS2]